jgi:hypothetical protein
MTPQERQRVKELFDRLATLEGAARDTEAEREIAQGLARAPNAAYALVQTVLVQNEALNHAETRIRELEEQTGGHRPEGFLDTMRGALFGRGDHPRGSVPSVPQASKWNSGGPATVAYPSVPTPPGSSFLGTAAAAAVGVIGGSLLFNSLHSLMGGAQGSAFASPSDAQGDRQGPRGGDASRSELAREAGLDDIGGSRASLIDHRSGKAAGLVDNNASDNADDFSNGDASGEIGGNDFGGGDIGDA